MSDYYCYSLDDGRITKYGEAPLDMIPLQPSAREGFIIGTVDPATQYYDIGGSALTSKTTSSASISATSISQGASVTITGAPIPCEVTVAGPANAQFFDIDGTINLTFALYGDYTITLRSTRYLDKVFSVLVQIPVSKTADFRWDVTSSKVVVGAEFQWDVRNAVQKSADIRWDVLNGVTKSADIRWDVLSAVEKTADLQWDVVSSVSITADFQWNIVNAVPVTADFQWDVISAVEKTADIRWDVLESAEYIAAFEWDVQ